MPNTNWRMAAALEVLREQLNAVAPKRSRASDGGIGDERHQSLGRDTDHNPWVRDGSQGVVTARDFTHDPTHGANMHMLTEALRSSRDPRIKYVIWQGRLFRSYPKGKLPAWNWDRYAGENPHTKHAHISVLPERALYDDRRPWHLLVPLAPPPGKSELTPVGPHARRTLRQGMFGGDVAFVQRFIGGTAADGVFGADTRQAVIAYQRMRGLDADGVVGAVTWRNILERP